MHRTVLEFWEHFAALPESVQRTARRNFQRLREDPGYPSLRLKKVGDYWVARVGRSHRALAVAEAKISTGSGLARTTPTKG